MKELITANWMILSPIVLMSVLGLGIIIERFAYFRKIRPRSGSHLDKALRRLDIPSRLIMENFDPRDISPAKKLLESALTSRLKTVPQFYKQELEAICNRYIDRMERYWGILPGIANLATLMGLFGTVSGMITAFSKMNQSGNSDPYVLAGGISRALVTTAAGLLVAIPVLLAHHLLENATKRHVERMEEVLSECLSISGAIYAHKRESKET